MKIGEKKVWKKGKSEFTIERIKFDWKAFVGWIVFVGLIVWLIWYR